MRFVISCSRRRHMMFFWSEHSCVSESPASGSGVQNSTEQMVMWPCEIHVTRVLHLSSPRFNQGRRRRAGPSSSPSCRGGQGLYRVSRWTRCNAFRWAFLHIQRLMIQAVHQMVQCAATRAHLSPCACARGRPQVSVCASSKPDDLNSL